MKVDIIDSNLRIIFEGEINLYNVADLRNQINKIIEENIDLNKIEFNLASVPYIDSSGIGFLVQIQRKLKNLNKILYLSEIQKEVIDSFILSNIVSHFNIK